MGDASMTQGAEVTSWAHRCISELKAENEKQRGVIEMLMERCRWLQEESGELYGALEMAPKPWTSGKPFGYWRWWWKVRRPALSLCGETVRESEE